ncbi:MAG: tRNA pseudouridine13 synthase [Oleiphilaceae bacterium]|jgi:tRNA pseudouridine13 synthase
MSFDLDFPRASKEVPAQGVIKAGVADFYVEELMDPVLANEGEHTWLWIEKEGQNTEYVAGLLAEYSGVKKMDVGFSGMKDRWAQTRQWFSIYLGAKSEPDWSAFDEEGVRIIKLGRHVKKLRRGEHRGNRFKIIVRDLVEFACLSTNLEFIQKQGFPNYYGPQRFGYHGANLERGARYFAGEIKASRSQRSFYLSAARSYLFNLNLADAVNNETWHSDTVGGPLYGDQQEGVAPLSSPERLYLDNHPSLAKGIHKNRLKLERRSYCIVPASMCWEQEGDMLTLGFDLPTGIFATSLLAEFLNYRVLLGEA